MSQLFVVKVNVAGFTVASPVSLEVTEMTTSLEGLALRTTVKVSVVPASLTSVPPPVSATVNPATSSSVVVAVTVWSATESKSSSVIASTIAIVIVDEIVPSMILSSDTVKVAVCGVSQFQFVKVRVLVTVASPVSLEDIERTTSDAG